MDDRFPAIPFRGELRPSQREVVEVAEAKLAAGHRQVYVVAPPGSGKTVTGLYLWAQVIRRPALVLSPNSAIQAQWAQRTDMFALPGASGELVSTDGGDPRLLTSLTYQAVTLPRGGAGGQDAEAIVLWQDKLIETGQAEDPQEALVWIEDLAQHNPAYYDERLSSYRKQVRDRLAAGGRAIETLHASALKTLERLRERGIGLIILDECHHLLSHWGRVLADTHALLGEPVIVGLTATPPERRGKDPEDLARYDAYLGAIDYEVPIPAVVKDGFLAPFQDLAYLVRPSAAEIEYVASADRQLHALVDTLCEPRDGERAEPLPEWVGRVLSERLLANGPVKSWTAFERRDPELALAGRLFLLRRGLPLPGDVPEPMEDLGPEETPEMAILVPVLDRYVRHRLRRSPHAVDRERAEEVVRRLRTLGVQITETGTRPCASPVGRVLAYSRRKAEGAVEILRTESGLLGEAIRAAVVTDYEKTAAVTAEVGHLLDEEAGGAIAVYRALLRDAVTDRLDPILVTGASVLVDDDLAARFEEEAQHWLSTEGFEVTIEFREEDGFHLINGRGADWCPRVYVALITELFQRGVTRCLVGTRGLLGEGWDASRINVLVDLTTVTSSMSVNQLRGRSIRLDSADPQKLSNNWDVVCIAPEFSKGLDDYARFIAKHKTLFGITDDGAIEKGVGHVHPAFTELKPEAVEDAVNVINADMLARAGRRTEVRAQWRIGEPYRGTPVRTLEARLGGAAGGFPPFAGAREPWRDASLTLAVGRAVLGALEEAGLIKPGAPVQVRARAGGYVRSFLETAAEEDSARFITALHQALGPLRRPRYVIPRVVERRHGTWLSRILPEIVGRYFERRRRERVMLHAVPADLADHKDRVHLYQRHWNAHVSPGEAIYAHHGAGEALVEEAVRAGQVPGSLIHEKEVFQ